MIVRRIGDAIRSQDWFVVLIEILVVIFGVFIGLQFDDWNNERIDRARELVILNRLLSEAEVAVADVAKYVEQRAERNEQLENMVAFVSDPVKFPLDQEEAALSLTRMTHFPALKPPRTVLDELQASGDFQLIRSQAVRDAMSRYTSSLAFHDSQLDAFRGPSDRLLEVSLPYLSAEYSPGGPAIREIHVDWALLRADSSLVYVLLAMMRNQLVFQSYRQDILDEARLMCEALAHELGRECRPVIPGSG